MFLTFHRNQMLEEPDICSCIEPDESSPNSGFLLFVSPSTLRLKQTVLELNVIMLYLWKLQLLMQFL